MKDFQQEISTFKLMLVGSMPFYGEVILRVPITEDIHIPTACTNGRIIKYNPRFFCGLDRGERFFVIMHELMHIILMHPYRLGNKNPALWNVASDIVVNKLLDDMTKTMLKKGIPFQRPSDGIFQKMYWMESTEQVYARICENNNEKDESIYLVLYPVYGDSPAKIIVRPDLDYPSGEASAGSFDGGISQKELGALLGELMKKNYSDSPSAEIVRELKDILKAGKRKDWQKVLRNYLYENISDETSYATPERKYLHMDMIIPGYSLTAERIEEIWAFVDCSGSVSSEEMKEFLFHLYHITSEFKCVMNICYWDTSVTDIYLKIRKKENILKSLPKHSGGTDVNCIYKWLRENRITPDVMMILTDGYFSELNDEAFIPSLKKKTILVLNNQNVNSPDFRRIGQITRL